MAPVVHHPLGVEIQKYGFVSARLIQLLRMHSISGLHKYMVALVYFTLFVRTIATLHLRE